MLDLQPASVPHFRCAEGTLPRGREPLLADHLTLLRYLTQLRASMILQCLRSVFSRGDATLGHNRRPKPSEGDRPTHLIWHFKTDRATRGSI